MMRDKPFYKQSTQMAPSPTNDNAGRPVKRLSATTGQKNPTRLSSESASKLSI